MTQICRIWITQRTRGGFSSIKTKNNNNFNTKKSDGAKLIDAIRCGGQIRTGDGGVVVVVINLVIRLNYWCLYPVDRQLLTFITVVSAISHFESVFFRIYASKWWQWFSNVPVIRPLLTIVSYGFVIHNHTSRFILGFDVIGRSIKDFEHSYPESKWCGDR